MRGEDAVVAGELTEVLDQSAWPADLMVGVADAVQFDEPLFLGDQMGGDCLNCACRTRLAFVISVTSSGRVVFISMTPTIVPNRGYMGIGGTFPQISFGDLLPGNQKVDARNPQVTARNRPGVAVQVATQAATPMK